MSEDIRDFGELPDPAVLEQEHLERYKQAVEESSLKHYESALEQEMQSLLEMEKRLLQDLYDVYQQMAEMKAQGYTHGTIVLDNRLALARMRAKR